VTEPPAGPPAPPPPPTEAAALVCYRHPDRVTGVRCTRCERPICPACMITASVGFQCPECVAAGRKTVRTPRTMYGGAVPRGGFDVTTLLVGINLAVFLITVASGANLWDGRGNSSVYTHFALRPTQVAAGEWWRLFTSMFLHFGIPHIFFNMWALLVIGRPLEQLLGRVRFLTVYLLAGIGGGLLSVAFGPLSEFAAGASGAIFGLFGAFYVINRRRGLDTSPIVGLIAINLIFSFTFSGIDWRGHVGGLVVGCAVAFALVSPPPGPTRKRLQAAGCIVVAVALVASGLGAARHVRSECSSLGDRFATGSLAPQDGLSLAACGAAGLVPGLGSGIAG
jgi:membrane associated rhomboid family serine protease